MAISRPRFLVRAPWGHGPTASPARDTTSAARTPPGPATAPEPGPAALEPTVAVPEPTAATRMADPSSASTSRRRSSPPRGPDGRFLPRSAAAPAISVRPSTVAAAATLSDVLAADVPTTAAPLPPDTRPRVGLRPGTAQAGLLGGSTDEPILRVEAVVDQPIRLVLVEDVPDVAVHVREMLRAQPRFRLVHVISDGRRAVDEIRDLQPDVVLVDALLQGRTSGETVVQRLRSSGSQVGIVALTVPDHPIGRAMAEQADSVVTLPFGTYDLGRGILDAHGAGAARDPAASSRIVTVFAPKGGVGKTTIAYNLAVCLASTGLRTLLIDGSLQFGDVRRLLRADPKAPSICDLPTDCVRGSDLADNVVTDAAGVDILLAPPRPELAELVNGSDLEQVLGVLRHAYQAIVIDTPSVLSEPTLAFLDAADVILSILTTDPAALDGTRMIAATFAEIGYPATKVRYLVNRADSVGPLTSSQIGRVIGREPDYTVASDWQLVAASNAEGVPFVLARPDAPASADLRRVADDIRAITITPSRGIPVRRLRAAR